MSKSTKKWLPCLLGNPDSNVEVEAALPLHDPNAGWVQATFLDGHKELLDLTQVLKQAHEISRLELSNSVASISLYRVLLSIIYDAFDFEVSRDSWEEGRLDNIENNEGFNAEWVNEYFSRFSDRFYLIHPQFPFLQDPSLYTTYDSKPLAFSDDEEDREKYRDNFSSKLSFLSQVFPLAPSVNDLKTGANVIWGIPPEDVMSRDLTVPRKIDMLVTSLFNQRYSHGAVMKGARTFFDREKGNDTHNAVHSLRCAVYYNLEVGSLFQQLLMAMDYVPAEDLENDIPEWERTINPTTGFLGSTGYSVDYSDVYSGPNAPRSSVNLTHMAMLLVPEFDSETNKQYDTGGHVKQIRRLLFNFKDLKDEEGNKLSFPLSWNPYIAVKNDDNKALKQVTPISDKTALSNPRLFRIPLLPTSDIRKPSILDRFSSNEDLQDIFGRYPQNVRMFVLSGEAAQEKTYSDFTMVTNEASSMFSNDEMVNRLERWIDDGYEIRGSLWSNIKNAVSDEPNDKVDLDSPIRVFWERYQGLFFSSFIDSSLEPIEDHKKNIMDIVSSIYSTSTQHLISVAPIRVAKHYNFLMGKTYKVLNSESKEKK